jgi:hypothetical protein
MYMELTVLLQIIYESVLQLSFAINFIDIITNVIKYEADVAVKNVQ